MFLTHTGTCFVVVCKFHVRWACARARSVDDVTVMRASDDATVWSFCGDGFYHHEQINLMHVFTQHTLYEIRRYKIRCLPKNVTKMYVLNNCYMSKHVLYSLTLTITLVWRQCEATRTFTDLHAEGIYNARMWATPISNCTFVIGLKHKAIFM